MVAAESIEFDGLRKNLDTRVLDWGISFSVLATTLDWALVANGPGKRLASEAVSAACLQVPVTAVVSVGFCGGLDPSLPIGAIVIANQVSDGDSRRTYTTGSITQAPAAATGLIVSTDRVAVTALEKKHLANNGAIAVEMEASGLAAAAERRGLPFYCAKVVSDPAAEDMPLDFNRYRKADGRFHRKAIALAALARPFTRIPALYAFQRNCRFASTQLGDFLVKCHF